MTWTNVRAGTLRAAEQEFWKSVGDRAGDVAAGLSTDSEYAALVSQYALHLISEQTPLRLSTWKGVRAVLGRRFVSPLEAAILTGTQYTDDQLKALEDALPHHDELQLHRDEGMYLVPGPSTPTVMEDRFQNKLVQEIVVPGWIFVSAIPFGKPELSLSAQRDSMPKNRHVPTYSEMIWLNGLLRARGEISVFQRQVRYVTATNHTCAEGRVLVVYTDGLWLDHACVSVSDYDRQTTGLAYGRRIYLPK